MKIIRKAGATSNILQIFISDSTSTTGGGLTGLTSANPTAYYHRDTDTTATAITLASMTVGTFTSSGFKEIDATNMPGWYQFCPPDAAFAAGAKSVALHLKGAANMAPLPIEVQLTATDIDDSVRGGMTALPNAAAEAAGGLYTRGTGAGQINQPSNGAIDANVTKVGGTTQTAGDLAAMITVVDDFLDTEIAAIKAKTDNLPSDPADASDIATSFSGVNTKLDTIDDFLDTEIAAIKAKTDNLPSDPADASDIAGAFTTVNTKLDTIDDFLDTEIAAIKSKTDNLPSDPADASDIAGAFTTVNTKLDTIDDFLDTEIAAIKAKTDNLPSDPADQSLVIAATDAIAALIGTPAGASVSADIAALPTATEIEDAVWDAALTDHADAGTTGEALADAGGAGTITVADVVDGILDEAIVGHNTAGTVGKAIIDIGAKTVNLPSDPADASVVAGLISAVEAKVDTIDDFLDTEIAAIKAKTDNLPSDPADASDVAGAFTTVNTKLDTIDDFLDTEIAAIKAKTDNLPAAPASQGDVTTVGSDVTAIKSKTDNLPASPAASSYKKNTAISGFQFQMFDDTVGNPATGLTVAVKVSKDGGALSNSANAVTELTLGWYKISLDAAEMNAKTVALNFAATGAKSYGVVLPTEG